MADYPNSEGTTTVVERRSNGGVIIGGILLVIALIVGFLFATGFWSADVSGGALPTVAVSAKGGELPEVDMKSKEIVASTAKTTVVVPKVETQKTTIDVPVVGVKDDSEK